MTLKGGGGELGDSRELIFKKSKSEPFLLLEHPPPPQPPTISSQKRLALAYYQWIEPNFRSHRATLKHTPPATG